MKAVLGVALGVAASEQPPVLGVTGVTTLPSFSTGVPASTRTLASGTGAVIAVSISNKSSTMSEPLPR